MASIVEAIRAERAHEILINAGFDRSFQEYRIDGLPGFSLRSNVPGNLGGLSAREQIIIESVVRDNTLIIQISNTLEIGSKRIVEYRMMQSNGKPLPEWLDRAGRDLLIGRRDANVDTLFLKVEAVYSDGIGRRRRGQDRYRDRRNPAAEDWPPGCVGAAAVRGSVQRAGHADAGSD